MKKLLPVLFLTAFVTLIACGGNVVVDKGAGGTGGLGPAACPTPPSDKDVMDLVGKVCSPETAVCASNNGCGGCSVTCANGVWTSTDSTLCFDIGPTC